MPLAKIHVVEDRYDETRIAKVSKGVDHGFVSFSLGLAGHSDLLVSRDAVGRC
jgi:hypothetical protein